MAWQRADVHLVHTELNALPLEELVTRFRHPAPEGRKHGLVFYDDVAVAIRNRGKAGVEFLLRVLPRVDVMRTRAILTALSYPPAIPGARELLRGYLGSRHAMVQMQAIEGLRRLEDRNARDQARTLLGSRSPYVRGAILRYLGELFPGEVLPVLLEALHDRSNIARESAVDVLDELGAVQAIPAIRPLLSDRHRDVRQAAKTAIENLEALARDGDPATTPEVSDR